MNPDPDDVTFEFNQVNANDNSNSVEQLPESDDVTFRISQLQITTDEEAADVEDEEEEFTFTCLTEKTAIPLFDKSLLHAATSSSSLNEMNIKSNSTGFSNLQRLRDDNYKNNNNDNMNRSKSDGGEAFGFLNHQKTRENAKKAVVVVKKKKGEKPTVSALEEYLRRGEEERRKAYLPYSNIRRRPAQVRPSGLTGVLYSSIKKSLKVASNILPT